MRICLRVESPGGPCALDVKTGTAPMLSGAIWEIREEYSDRLTAWLLQSREAKRCSGSYANGMHSVGRDQAAE